MKLSKNLIRELSVPVMVINPPADKVLLPSTPNYVKILVEGNGFSLLKSYRQNATLTVDFSDLQEVGENFYTLSKNSKDKLSNTYLSNFRIRSVVSDTIQLYLAPKHSKKIPVVVRLNVEFPKEYQLTELRLTPDSVVATGSQKVIDTLTQVTFQYRHKRPLKDNFGETYTLKNTPWVHYNAHKIVMQAFVDKVSEQELTVPVKVVGAPKGSQVKVFPSEVSVLCTGELAILKTLTPDDIQVIADVCEANGSNIPLQLSTHKRRVKMTFMKENTVDFLIRKE
ncbi:hypothetical protein RCZ04_20990 [Capnocytophaga sp. HP1101]